MDLLFFRHIYCDDIPIYILSGVKATSLVMQTTVRRWLYDLSNSILIIHKLVVGLACYRTFPTRVHHPVNYARTLPAQLKQAQKIQIFTFKYKCW